MSTEAERVANQLEFQVNKYRDTNASKAFVRIDDIRRAIELLRSGATEGAAT